MYSLFIRRYRRHMNFDSIVDLKDELSSYFTQREIQSGIVDRLVNFNTTPIKDGYCKNSYQDFEVCWYPLDEE